MNEETPAGRGRRALPRRMAALTAALAGAALLAACSGGSPAAGGGAGSGQTLSQRLDSYASCMRSHGEPGFYFSRPGNGPPSPGAPELIFDGYVAPIDPGSPQFQSAQKACQHLLPKTTQPSAAELHQQFIRTLKAVACLRAHGYPDWPDPIVQNGQLFVPAPPAGIDTSSPQFQATVEACGARLVLPPGEP